MSLVDRYIAGRILRGIVTAFVIVTAIIMLVDFVEATRNIGEDGNLSMLTILGLTALKAPQLIEQTIPFVVLFGVMGALYGLNKRSELIVLRASGLSAWRFLRPAVFVTGLLGIIWAIAFNPLATQAMQRYEMILASYSQTSEARNSATKPRQLWLREGSDTGQIVIRGFQSPSDMTTLTDVTFYYYDYPDARQLQTDQAQTDPSQTHNDGIAAQTQFSRRIDAARATLLPSGYWQLRALRENSTDNGFARQDFASLPTRLTLNDLRLDNRRNLRPPFWALPSEIARVEAAGFSAVGLRMQWHGLLSLPLTLIAMTMIAAGVSMHLTRSGGTLRLMLAGGCVGFGVYFFNNLMTAFGQAQSMPIIMAAWSVPLLVLFCGTAYLSKIEDG